MGRYSVESKKGLEVVLKDAIDYFGQDGLGLEVVDCAEGCARFEGGGGHVFITACIREKTTEVELETREWDYHVKKFMGTL